MSWRDIRLITIFLLLAFLFEGDPDVWDKLRERAMKSTTEECKHENQ